MKHILFYALFFILKIASAQAQSLDQPKNYPADAISSFAERLEPMGRILEDDNYYVWCCAPIIDEKNKVHVFYSRWEKKYEMKGWLGHCEIAHAVADQPEGPYKYVSTVLSRARAILMVIHVTIQAFIK